MTRYMVSITAEATLNKIIDTDNTPEEVLQEVIMDVRYLDEEVGDDFILSINKVTYTDVEEIEDEDDD